MELWLSISPIMALTLFLSMVVTIWAHCKPTLSAAMFHLLGPSLFSLRLSVLLLFVLFLVGLYLLTRTLYSRGLALVTIALLSFGSNYLLTYQLRSYGGYPDTLLFGTLAFLIASWLAISSKPEFSFRSMSQRCLGYAAWGLIVGLGIWSDQIILPFVAISGLLLLLFCWRRTVTHCPSALHTGLPSPSGCFP